MPPVEFLLFAITLLAVALFHRYTLQSALVGLAGITLYKLLATDFRGVAGLQGLLTHLGHEWVVLTNLFALLVGFALLGAVFSQTFTGDGTAYASGPDLRGFNCKVRCLFVFVCYIYFKTMKTKTECNVASCHVCSLHVERVG